MHLEKRDRLFTMYVRCKPALLPAEAVLKCCSTYAQGGCSAVRAHAYDFPAGEIAFIFAFSRDAFIGPFQIVPNQLKSPLKMLRERF